MIRWLLITILAVILPAGCGLMGRSFMGVPEYKQINMEDENPQTPLRGIPKMTAVQKTDYRNYVSALSQGRVIAEERYGGWVYFAIAKQYWVPAAPDGQAGAPGVMVVVTERYKAQIPDVPQPLEPVSKRPLSTAPKGVQPRGARLQSPPAPPKNPPAPKTPPTS